MAIGTHPAVLRIASADHTGLWTETVVMLMKNSPAGGRQAEFC